MQVQTISSRSSSLLTNARAPSFLARAAMPGLVRALTMTMRVSEQSRASLRSRLNPSSNVPPRPMLKSVMAIHGFLGERTNQFAAIRSRGRPCTACNGRPNTR